MQKTMLISVALIGLIGLSVLLLWPRPCDGIFEQTAPNVKVNLKIIENEGAFAVSREKIQELSESAQKVGLHLKTCCTVLDVGNLDPKQFQQCIDKASGYEKQIAFVVQHVTEAAQAKEKGATEVLQEKITSINEAIKTTTSEAEKFARQEIKPQPIPAGLGAIKIANLEARTVEVYSQESNGKSAYEPGFVGEISPKATTLEVPAGMYKLKFTKHFVERVEVRGGTSTEIQLGAINLPELRGRTVEVYSQESNGKSAYEPGFVGEISPKATKLQVPAGTYKVKFAKHFLQNVSVAPGEEVTL